MFYFFIVAVMFLIQMILFDSEGCSVETPILYFWLLAQVCLFYFLVAYGLALWGSYICWQSHNQEAIIKHKMKHYIKEIMKKEEGEHIKHQLGVPLLS